MFSVEKISKSVTKRIEFAITHFNLRQIKGWQDVLNYLIAGSILLMANVITLLIGWTVYVIGEFIVTNKMNDPNLTTFWQQTYLILFLIPLLISLIPFEKVGNDSHALKIMSVLAFICFPFSVFYYAFLTNIVNLFIPGRLNRNAEVDQFIQTRESLIREQFKIKELTDLFPFSNELKRDPDSFIETHFQLTQSFKRFFLERVLIRNKVMDQKVLFLLLLPRKKTMPIATLREIILASNFLEKSAFLTPEQVDILSETVRSGGTDEYFSNLTLEQIKLIFTRPFDWQEYFNLICDLSFSLDQKLHPATTMDALIENAPITIEKMNARLKHKYLKNLKDFIPNGYSSKLLLSPRDFNEAGVLFSNCVAAYKDYESDVFVVTHEDFPVACVEVKNHKVSEINGYQNQSVPLGVRDMIYVAIKNSRSHKK